MEHKSVLMLRTRIVQLESQHNNLTSLVVSLMRNMEVLKKRVLSIQGTGSSRGGESVESVENDIQKLLNSTNGDNEDRTKELLEELKKAQYSN